MELIKLLPGYYYVNDTMVLLQSILQFEADILGEGLTSAVNQGFIGSATTELERWERLLGLEVDGTKSAEFRRERIIARLSGVGTTTKQMIVDTCISYSNGEVEVIEDNANYKFTVKFVGAKGVVPNMSDLTKTLEEIKPAHLKLEYEFIYITHEELKRLTHRAMKSYTHEQIRNEVING